ncbi:MAG TPA: hypothetical protein VLC55_14325 [Burkholderiales bacterium]|nr:hypothetical protein [Burkholderiales bacterium]
MTTHATAARPAHPALPELTLFIGPPATPADLAEYCAATKRHEAWGDPAPASEFLAFRTGLVGTLLEEVDGSPAPLKELLERIIGEPIGTLRVEVTPGEVSGERCPALRIDLTDSVLATGAPLVTRLGDHQIRALTGALGSVFGAQWVVPADAVAE